MLELNLIENLRSEYQGLEKYVNEIEETNSIPQAISKFKKLSEAAEAHFKAEMACVYTRCVSVENSVLKELVRLGEQDYTDLKQMLWSMANDNRVCRPEWKQKIRDIKNKLMNYSNREIKDLFPELRKAFDEKQMGKIRNEYITFNHKKQKPILYRNSGPISQIKKIVMLY